MSQKNKGWRGESKRHSLARKGIKTVSVTKSQRKQIAKALNPLIEKKLIAGYSIVEKPEHIKEKSRQVRYSHDTVKRHRNVIEEQLKFLGLDYEIVPKEKYVKGKKKKEYQVIATGNPDQIFELTRFLKRRTTDFSDIIQFTDTQLNPAESTLDAIELKNARIVPDMRVLHSGKIKDFVEAKRISKNIDSDTELVVLTIRPSNTKAVEKALKGEKVTEVLIQDFIPPKHSQKNYIINNTQPA